jgi:predicted ATPase/DNA-binding SARP family transcriptional activator
MRFRVLGAVELVDEDGTACAIRSASQRTVLGVLLARPGQVVSLDALVEALWGATPPPSAVPTLRTYVSRLRAHVGAALASRGGGFALDVAPGDLDAERFETLVDSARDADANDAVDLLVAALDLWKGPAFGDCADVEGVRAEARRLEERRSAAAEARAAALLRAGRVDEAVAAAEAVVTAEPLREGGWSVLIEALTGAHRAAEALRTFQRASGILAEAGLDPSNRLREAERAALSADTTPPPVVVELGPTTRQGRFQPPVAPSSLVGRDDDDELILDLFARARLVTLTGPGGVGKTRLALEVAGRAAVRTALGACMVELASVDDPAAVPDIIVASLGLTAEGRAAEEVLPRAGALELLLVLDNAEHLIDAVAAAVARILTGGPSVRVLVTSRERLALDGEHVWAVAPLGTTGPEAPATRLFLERASAVGAAPDEEVVARIVQRLDGLPLAIEMAAAQLDTTTAEEVADALDGHLDELRSPRRQVPARHRGLADVLAWSEARLEDRDASVLADLSVFAGPVVARDIEGVLDRPGVADVVRALATRSLVTVDRTHTPARFYLLQTIRSFAARRLAEAGRTEELARRHAEWFASAARTADLQLRTAEEDRGQDRLDSIFVEARAAHGWAARHDPDLAAELTACLYLYAHSRFVEEPLLWAELLLEQIAADHPRRATLLAAAATRALRRGDITEARRLAAEGLELAGDSEAAVPVLDVMTDIGLFDGRVAESGETARALRDLASRHGDLLHLALGQSSVALAAAYGGHADPDGEVQLAALQELPLPPSGRGWLAYTSGELSQEHDPHRALACFADALAEARTVQNRYLEGAAIVSACSLQARISSPAEALGAFADAVRHWIRLANTAQQLTTLRNLAVLFQRAGAPEALAELLGAVDEGGVPTYGEEADRLGDARAWALAELGQAQFTELTAAGAARDVSGAAHAALQVIDTLATQLHPA